MIRFLEAAFLAIGLITIAAALCVIIGFFTEAKAADLDALDKWEFQLGKK